MINDFFINRPQLNIDLSGIDKTEMYGGDHGNSQTSYNVINTINLLNTQDTQTISANRYSNELKFLIEYGDQEHEYNIVSNDNTSTLSFTISFEKNKARQNKLNVIITPTNYKNEINYISLYSSLDASNFRFQHYWGVSVFALTIDITNNIILNINFLGIKSQGGNE
jgi:hypothetical protein